MKILVVYQLTEHGKETNRVCHASTLRNAFKKASMRDWEYYRIYKVYNNKVPHIIFESLLPKDRGSIPGFDLGRLI